MDDYPIAEIPDTPNWAENFCLAGYDPGSGIDVYLHIGRWRKDRRLWRELVAIRLPDDTVIAHRAIGNGRAEDRSPGGPNMRVRILEPGRHFEWDFLGGARRVPADCLRDNILDDGPLSRVQFTFDYVADLPAWDLGTAGEGSAMVGHGHVEQIGRARAEIRVKSGTPARLASKAIDRCQVARFESRMAPSTEPLTRTSTTNPLLRSSPWRGPQPTRTVAPLLRTSAG